MEKKAEPREFMTLDNFTVDYADVDAELKPLGGKHFFNAVREGDTVTLATDDENERIAWIQALYRATGQSHKPTPPSALAKNAASQLAQSSSSAGNHLSLSHLFLEYIYLY
jgi:hypothetical protein